MAQQPASDPTLDELLKRLDSVPDKGASRATYTGRAVSKSNKHLRLAIDTGVIAIPLDSIDRVTPLSPGDTTIVRVEVREATNVTHVVHADPVHRESMVSAMRAARPIIIRGPIVITGDTDTITGGRPDACDDTIVIVNW
jgi:hypothetical protein